MLSYFMLMADRIIVGGLVAVAVAATVEGVVRTIETQRLIRGLRTMPNADDQEAMR